MDVVGQAPLLTAEANVQVMLAHVDWSRIMALRIVSSLRMQATDTVADVGDEPSLFRCVASQLYNEPGAHRAVRVGLPARPTGRAECAVPIKNLTVRRALLGLVVASVLPTFIAAVAALLYAYTQKQAGFRDGLRETTRALALVVDREIATREAVALTLSGSPSLTRGDLETFREYALQIAPTRDKVVVLHDLAGQQLVNTRVPVGEPLPKSQNTKERIEAGPMATVVSNLYFAPVGKQYSFAVQVPVVWQGQVLYHLSVAGYASALQSVMTHQGLPAAWIFSILDRKGVVVARNIAPEQFVGKATSDRLAAQMAQRAEGVFESTTLDGTPILAAFSKSPTYGWSVAVGVPLAAIPAPLESVALFGVFAAFLLGGALLLAVATGRRLLKPIERLKDASRALGSSRLLAIESTGLRETDLVLASLQEADRRITGANEALELRRREAEAAAAQVGESEARLLRLANTIPNLAWIADAEGSITWYNDRWYAYTGTTPAEMEGWGWQSVHDPAVLPEVMQKWQESIRTGQAFEMTFPLRGADGIYRPFFTRVAPVSDSGGKLVQWFGTNTDVSPLKQAENELREADQRKDEFLAMLSHELRNPLGPIRNAVEILARLDDSQPVPRTLLDVVRRQVQHMVRLLDDLLDVTRVTQGRIMLQRRPTAVSEVIQRAVEATSALVSERQQQFTLELPSEPLFVDGDAVRLTQVFSNLLQNACKYTPEGGQISLRVQRVDESVVIRVEDNGIGISAGMLPHVFDLFTQDQRGMARSQGGLGIGLTVVRSIVTLHGGTVEVNSDARDQGSEFIVTLPLITHTGEVANAPPAAAVSTHASVRILMIEDNQDAAEVLAELLRLAGHQVKVALDGAKGLELFEHVRPDVVLCDVGLPGMNGYEVAERMRERRPSKKPAMIALTGYGSANDRQRALSAGFDHHVIKPADPEALLQLIDSATRRTSPTTSGRSSVHGPAG